MGSNPIFHPKCENSSAVEHDVANVRVVSSTLTRSTMENRYGEKLTKYSMRFYKDDGTFVSEVVDYFLNIKEAWKRAKQITREGQWYNVTKY